MKNINKVSVFTAFVVGLVACVSVAHASSHREAPAIAYDPAADNTDVYAWVEPGTHDKMYIVANWIPLEEPSGGPNFHKFSDDVRYTIHIARGDSLYDSVAYQFHFRTSRLQKVDPADTNAALGGGKEFFAQLSGQTQTLDVIKVEGNQRRYIGRNIPVAPVNIGPRTQAVLYDGAPYDDAFASRFITDLDNGEGRIFAGPRDDGFYADLGGIFDLANLRGKGDAQDGVSGFNTHSIALEIPTTLLTSDGAAPQDGPSMDNTLGIWASSERRKITIRRFNGKKVNFGPWVQVSRLGLPLINEVVIGIQDKDRFNASHPVTDVARFGSYFLNPVIVRDAEAVGIYEALGVDPTPLKFGREDIIGIISLNALDDAYNFSSIGDVLRVDLGVDSGFPNGRPIVGGARPDQEQADVTDVLVNVILAGDPGFGLSDGVDYNDKPFLTTFPFLALPHEGFSEGHGTPTP